MFTVILNTNRTLRYYPCSCEEDMRVLKSALSLKFGDLQVSVRQVAANDDQAERVLTDFESGNTVQASRRRPTKAQKKHLDAARGS